jgi:hypothetical protein
MAMEERVMFPAELELGVPTVSAARVVAMMACRSRVA